MIAQFFRFVAGLLAKLEVFFQQVMTNLSNLSLLDWLQGLIQLVLILLLLWVVFKLSLLIMKNTLRLLQVTLQVLFVVLIVLALYYWFIDTDRGCMFRIESVITRCSIENMSDFNFADSWQQLKTWFQSLVT